MIKNEISMILKSLEKFVKTEHKAIKNRRYLPHYWSDKGFQGTSTSIHGKRQNDLNKIFKWAPSMSKGCQILKRSLDILFFHKPLKFFKWIVFLYVRGEFKKPELLIFWTKNSLFLFACLLQKYIFGTLKKKSGNQFFLTPSLHVQGC